MTTKTPCRCGKAYQCPLCKTVIQSMHRHDYVDCGCPNHASIDGGADYARIGYITQPPVRVEVEP